MSRKLLLTVAALLLSCVAVVAVLAFVVGFGNPVPWAQRQLTLLSVRGGPEVVLEVDAEAVRRRGMNCCAGTPSACSAARDDLQHAPDRFGRRDHSATGRSRDRDARGSHPVRLAGHGRHQACGRWRSRQLHRRRACRRTRKAAELSRDLITSRLTDLGMKVVVTIQPRQAGYRLLVQMARADDPKRLVEFATKPGELGFRLIDVTMAPEKAMASAPPPNSELLYGRKESGRHPYLVEKRAIMSGSDLIDAQPGFDARTNEPIVSFRFGTAGARNSRRRPARTSGVLSPSSSMAKCCRRRSSASRSSAGRARSRETSPCNLRTILQRCCATASFRRG